MINIQKGTLNRVGFSLSELSICGEPFEYRMEFKSENSEDINYQLIKTPLNLSNRLQMFEIDEGNEIDFELEGYYTYEIYQTASNNLVEIGLLRVVGPATQEQVMSQAINPQVYAG